ncbi:AAA family ATPase [Solirubrobacter sp. CPCC 204708]|uniref:AAA family ATPase n=1 Tax=Solirubrobacter deserti TaxID=2282478 RepID=A0ABT4RHB5_9ACTN|nr:helix-turn-helix transcriptional regulator [Solirubrobacter deserti]MBE2315180.1 AAA family ATPase [Solirubrobacter deserti]MDA0137863.1 AAA family ATPase [Solirubrobacter deserti]
MASRVTSTTFVGRAAELAELRAGLTEAAQGRPAIAFIAGESGLGKTRLVAELERLAREDGMRVIGGDCVELGESELPYAPIVGALRPLARSGHEAFAALTDPARAALAQILPGLGAAETRTDDEATAQARLFDGLLELLELLARDDGLLLTIEDLHWADRSTRAFLVYLASSLCRERVLVVTTYRPDELHRRHPLRPLLAELERDARARRVELRPLTRAELGEQLADILGAAPRPDLLDRLFSRSEGNPLFAEELLAAGLDGRGALPPTLRDALMLRIERLSPDAQELLRVIAAGRRLDHQILSAACDFDPRGPAREAVAAQLVVADEEGFYSFRHALLREVVVDDLLPGERASLHLALARALEERAASLPNGGGAYLATGIAHHYLESGDQPAALAASVRAGAAAESVHANGEAAALYSRALQLWDRVPNAEELTGLDHVELLRNAAWTNDREHEPARAESYLRAAIAELGDSDPVRTAQLLELTARQQFNQGRSAAAAETRREALALLPEGPSGTRATLLAGMAKELMLESRLHETLEVADEAIEVARAAGDQVSELRALDAKGVVLFGMARYEEGEAALREAMQRSQQNDIFYFLSTHVNMADALAGAGRLADARKIAAEGLELAAARGTPRRWLMLLCAELAFEAGEWDVAEAALPSPGRPAQGTTFINDALRRIELALGRGDHDTARTLLDAAEDVAADTREPQWIGPLGALRAELERRAGDLEAAVAAIDNALDRLDFCSQDVARMARVAASGVRVHADAAVRARDLGEDPELAIMMAEGLLARVEACAEGERPVERAFLTLAHAELARARDEDDPELWAAAVSAWQALGRPYRAAQAQRRRAEALLAGGNREGAAVAAAEALAAASAVGATWLASEIEGFALRARLRLDADEPSPPSAPTATEDGEDPFGLTPREKQVLALLAAGRTNREIGAALYMAEKTASVHVSRILSKLDVRSRTEAAAVAHRVGLV